MDTAKTVEGTTYRLKRREGDLSFGESLYFWLGDDGSELALTNDEYEELDRTKPLSE